MKVGTRGSLLAIVALLAIVSAGSTMRAQNGSPIANPGTRVGFNPQPDPPGFGIIRLGVGQTVHLNVVCFEHPLGAQLYAPPCRGQVMFHDAAGDLIVEGRYDLQPGQSTFLTFTRPRPIDDVNPVLTRLIINPCVLPAPDSGRAIPSVEVFDTAGHVVLFENPAAPKMSDFSNGFRNPGAIVGFNPQPDPPGFGLVTVRSDQFIRLNVTCFEHPIGGTPPDPCRGEVMFHNAAGDVVARGAYDLQPGQTTFLGFHPPDPGTGDVTGAPQMSINPCILPAPGGRAVPNVEVIDGTTGETALLINPAAARMTGFNHNETLVRDVPVSRDDHR